LVSREVARFSLKSSAKIALLRPARPRRRSPTLAATRRRASLKQEGKVPGAAVFSCAQRWRGREEKIEEKIVPVAP
jgi:hypothetical protein